MHTALTCNCVKALQVPLQNYAECNDPGMNCKLVRTACTSSGMQLITPLDWMDACCVWSSRCRMLLVGLKQTDHGCRLALKRKCRPVKGYLEVCQGQMCICSQQQCSTPVVAPIKGSVQRCPKMCKHTQYNFVSTRHQQPPSLTYHPDSPSCRSGVNPDSRNRLTHSGWLFQTCSSTVCLAEQSAVLPSS